MKKGTCKCVRGGRKLCRTKGGKVKFMKGRCGSSRRRR